MNADLQANLLIANRQVDTVIREIATITRNARDARTVSKIILISKLNMLETHARALEHSLELMAREPGSESAATK